MTSSPPSTRNATPPSPATAARKGLFMAWEPGAPHTRDRLVPVARTGARGFRVNGFLRLGPEHPDLTADHLAFLRDAAGVGLRVAWRGRLEGIDHTPLRHLDPPRDEEGKPAWPVPPRPLLTLRRGPGFVLVEDNRDGTIRRTVVDRPGEVAALVTPELGRVREDHLAPAAARSVRALAEQGFFASVCGHWLALPVRFRYARS
ncbi:DUF5825 family protein [Streptomyces sp. NPDC048111]|uniref:DUF5825 family protein n=1 Tax=Streptomyces sp. NPDC048111 TaxID=3365500 RepID=UPI00371E11A4